VTFTLGSGSDSQSCDATTDAMGNASCSIPSVLQLVGPVTLGVSFAGDSYYTASSTSATITVSAPPPAPTSLSTSLSGGGSSGTSISVPSGTAVTDTATLSGQTSAAGGTVTYTVYSDSGCTEAVGTPDQVDVTDGVAPASAPVTLTNTGTTPVPYYWGAVYSGDSANQGSSSTCGPAASGGETETVTSSSTSSTSPTTLATSLAVTGQKPCHRGWSWDWGWDWGWQWQWGSCRQNGTWNAKATSGCSKSSGSWGSGASGCQALSVPSGTAVKDFASLSGQDVSKATGTVTYTVYSDDACTDAVGTPDQVDVTNGMAPASDPVTLVTPGTYYWQATYSGDAANSASVSTCGSEVETVTTAPTTLTTTLSAPSVLSAGWYGSGHLTRVASTTAVTDTAVLSGTNASGAGGTVTYNVYGISSGSWQLIQSAGTVDVTDGVVPASDPVTLSAGLYLWQASYSADTSNSPSLSPWGSEIELVVAPPTCAPGFGWLSVQCFAWHSM
jgi:hypothetical protein